LSTSDETDATESKTESGVAEAATETAADGTTEPATTARSSDDESDTEFLPETTPDGFTHRPTESGISAEIPTTSGRSGSRFKDLGSLRELFAKRRNLVPTLQNIFFSLLH
jgi:hypothetical protein